MRGEPGGSSSGENALANYQSGYMESYGDPAFCLCVDQMPEQDWEILFE